MLYRREQGDLPLNIVAVVSNHTVCEPLAARYGVPFFEIPVTAATKEIAENELRVVLAKYRVDVVILARYMQVLSSELCADLHGRAINIHHSFLPGFKGAKPYHQAYERGVKLIGATAHFVTPELDEGPIIEQDVVRVSHAKRPSDLVSLGRDIERNVLARAVRLVAEDRVALVENERSSSPSDQVTGLRTAKRASRYILESITSTRRSTASKTSTKRTYNGVKPKRQMSGRPKVTDHAAFAQRLDNAITFSVTKGHLTSARRVLARGHQLKDAGQPVLDEGDEQIGQREALRSDLVHRDPLEQVERAIERGEGDHRR